MTELIQATGQRRDPLAIIDAATHLTLTTRVKYRRVLAAYLATGERLTNALALAEFAAGLSQSRQAQLRAAVRLWAKAMENEVRSQATPENLPTVDATLHRLTALQTAFQPKPQKGTKLHMWLTRGQVRELLDIDCTKLRDLRDKLALSLLVGAGLRREEAATLPVTAVQQLPGRTVLALTGKGEKDRIVPISTAMHLLIDEWRERAGFVDGYLLRSINRAGKVGDSISAVSLYKIVQVHGQRIGMPELAPHDLRRTYAQFGYDNGIDIGEISRLLGHGSIQTTQRYLNLETNFQHTISDHVPI